MVRRLVWKLRMKTMSAGKQRAVLHTQHLRRTQRTLTHKLTFNSLQFESVSTNIAGDEKKMLRGRSPDGLRAFRGRTGADSSRCGGGNRTLATR